MSFTTISVRGTGFAPSKKAELVKPPRSVSTGSKKQSSTRTVTTTRASTSR